MVFLIFLLGKVVQHMGDMLTKNIGRNPQKRRLPHATEKNNLQRGEKTSLLWRIQDINAKKPNVDA